MRHLKHTAKLGRTTSHRNAMLANLVCSLIKHRRIRTTLAKAKAVRPVAEKLVTLGKRGTLHDRRLAAARLRQQPRSFFGRSKERTAWRKQHDVVRILFEEIAPAFKERSGGYTRIVKLAARRGDASSMAILEWVDSTVRTAASGKPAPGKSAAAEAPSATPSTEQTKPGPAAS